MILIQELPTRLRIVVRFFHTLDVLGWQGGDSGWSLLDNHCWFWSENAVRNGTTHAKSEAFLYSLTK